MVLTFSPPENFHQDWRASYEVPVDLVLPLETIFGAVEFELLL